MKKAKYAGRRLVFWGAFLLLCLAGWEFYSRGDTVRWALEGLYNLCLNEGIPFLRALSYFDAGMFELIFFLLGCGLFSLFCMALRNRPRAGIILISLATALGVLGGVRFGWFTAGALDLLQSLKLIPMAMIALGCAANLVQFYALRRKKDENVERPRAVGRAA